MTTRVRQAVAAVVAGTCGVVVAMSSASAAAPTTPARAAAASAPATAPGPFVPGSGDRHGLVAISPTRRLYLECRGRGSPTVILVPGLLAAADTWSEVTDAAGVTRRSASAVYPEVARFTRVCSYDRPGTVTGSGGLTASTPVAQPTTPAADASDLNSLLGAARVPGPYVMVGWSFGGPIARLFASAHPRRVVGLVLVDSTSEYLERTLSPSDFAVFLALTRRDDQQRTAQWIDVERFDPVTAFAELRGAPRVRAMPVVVLSSDRFNPGAFAARLPAGAPADYPRVFWRAQLRSQDLLARLFPHGVHVSDTRSDHNIQNRQPQLVVGWIRRVVREVHGVRTGPRQ